MDRLRLKPASWCAKKDIPEGLDWSKRTIVLWQEDECLRHDRTAEHIEDAVVRICGDMYRCAEAFEKDDVLGVKRKMANPIEQILREEIDKIDCGDCNYTLYAWGWVICHSFDGSSLERVMLEDER